MACNCGCACGPAAESKQGPEERRRLLEEQKAEIERQLRELETAKR